MGKQTPDVLGENIRDGVQRDGRPGRDEAKGFGAGKTVDGEGGPAKEEDGGHELQVQAAPALGHSVVGLHVHLGRGGGGRTWFQRTHTCVLRMHG